MVSLVVMYECESWTIKHYAQLAKSPNDHQGADIRCKSKSFYYQARAGAPTVTDAAAKERSPEFWVTLLI